MICSLCCTVLCVVLSAFFLIIWRQTYWQRRGIPCSSYHYFYGHIKDLLTDKISLGESNLHRYKEAKKLKSRYTGSYFFLNPVLTILDLNLVKCVMLKDFDYFTGHGLYHHPRDILTMHLFNLEGNRWRTSRAKLSPTFTSAKIKLMFETILKKSQILDKVFQDLSASGPFAIKEVLVRFTTDNIASCAFGIQCNSLEEPDNIIRKFGKKMFYNHPINSWIKMAIPWSLLGYLGFKVHGKEVTDFFTNLVKDAIKSRLINMTQDSKNDFLQLLLKFRSTDGNNPDNLSDDEIIAHSFAFFTGGFESSATLMTFGVFELCKNQQVQQKLREEIHAAIVAHEGNISYQALKDMHYLDKVICETLRRYPPVTSVPRLCTKNYKIPDSQIVITKGTQVEIPIWGIHMDPDYYPNPEIFDPERFSEKHKAKRPDFSFIPFGGGPRVCIGLRFAILQAKIGLVTLLKNFELALSDKTKMPIKMDRRCLLLSVEGDIWITTKRI